MRGCVLSVHVVDKDAASRKALCEILGRGSYRASEHGSAEEFLAAGCDVGPACAFIADVLPGISGLELIQELRRRHSPVACVMMTESGSVRLAVCAMRSGALHCLEKPLEEQRVLALVDEAQARIARLPRNGVGLQEMALRYATLSPREKEVLELLAQGLPTKLIARQLQISIRTVDHHRAALMSKLDARTSLELVHVYVSLMPAAFNRIPD